MTVRNGKFFKHEYNVTGTVGWTKLSTSITRTDSFATYIIQPLGIVHRYKIDWINSCEYQLTPFGPLSWSDSLSMRFAPYSHKIIKVDKKYILETASTMVDTLWFDH